MKYLLDTCVISEMVKPQPDANVLAWVQNNNENTFYLSVLTFGELEKGIEKTQDLVRKNKLKQWVENDLKQRFDNRIIPIDLEVSSRWGSIQGLTELAGKPMPVIDGLIAASGFVYNCIVVTRNLADMEQSGVQLLNPWADER